MHECRSVVHLMEAVDITLNQGHMHAVTELPEPGMDYSTS
jgi:hypothetical protein